MNARRVDKTSAEHALNAALKLLSHRAYSERNLREKLREKDFQPAAIHQALSVCKEREFVDDRSFALDFIEQRLEIRPRAGHVLVRELLQRGVSPAIAKEIVAECVTTEMETESAQTLALKKWTQCARLGPEICFRRVSSYLARRGYNWETIREAIEKAKTAFNENTQE